MTITIDLIKQLRDQSGVSISACKKALEEAAGDLDKAFDLLRKKGEAKAKERSERATSEGIISMSTKDNTVAVVVIGCETDFVSKNADFIAEIKSFSDKLLDGSAIEDAQISDLGLKMGENVVLKKADVLDAPVIGFYVHSNYKLGAVVKLEGGTPEAARQIAMHVTAAQPKSLNPEDVDQTYIDKEIAFAKEELQASNKPEAIWEKILSGKESKLRSEVSLASQQFVVNPDMTVAAYAESQGAKLLGFSLYTI